MQDRGQHEAEMETEMEKFLQSTDFKDKYTMLMRSHRRFNVSLDEVREKVPKLAQFVIKEPAKAIKMFEDKANRMIEEMDSNVDSEKARLHDRGKFPTKQHRLKLNFEGNIGKNFVTPRGLKSSMINSLVRVQGIVTRMSIVKPKLSKSYHYIPGTKQGHVQNYRDQYSIEGQGDYAPKMFPTKDATGNPMSADYGY